MMRQLVDLSRFLWFEPRAPHAPAPGPRDGALVGVALAAALLEVALRPALTLASFSLLVGAAFMPTLYWRRTKPLSMVVIAFGATTALTLAELATGRALPTPHVSVFFLMLPYALFRWGAGREVLIGASIVLGAAALDLVANRARPSGVVGGYAVLLSAMALGAALRYRAHARAQELEQVKLREREQLSRELHDTVAHHVSAIAIRAQAGLAVAATRPDAALDALRLIEAEASRSLAEMRAIVRVLRRGAAAELGPQMRVADLADLAQLAERAAGRPVVEVAVSGDVDALPPAISAAIFRLAQESITNARRHARNATRIEVRVAADAREVCLRVHDDGDQTRTRSSHTGYGLVGMRERVALLGGSFDAGPERGRGWTVTAVFPREGLTR